MVPIDARAIKNVSTRVISDKQSMNKKIFVERDQCRKKGLFLYPK